MNEAENGEPCFSLFSMELWLLELSLSRTQAGSERCVDDESGASLSVSARPRLNLSHPDNNTTLSATGTERSVGALLALACTRASSLRERITRMSESAYSSSKFSRDGDVAASHVSWRAFLCLRGSWLHPRDIAALSSGMRRTYLLVRQEPASFILSCPCSNEWRTAQLIIRWKWKCYVSAYCNFPRMNTRSEGDRGHLAPPQRRPQRAGCAALPGHRTVGRLGFSGFPRD